MEAPVLYWKKRYFGKARVLFVIGLALNRSLKSNAILSGLKWYFTSAEHGVVKAAILGNSYGLCTSFIRIFFTSTPDSLNLTNPAVFVLWIAYIAALGLYFKFHAYDGIWILMLQLNGFAHFLIHDNQILSNAHRGRIADIIKSPDRYKKRYVAHTTLWSRVVYVCASVLGTLLWVSPDAIGVLHSSWTSAIIIVCITIMISAATHHQSLLSGRPFIFSGMFQACVEKLAGCMISGYLKIFSRQENSPNNLGITCGQCEETILQVDTDGAELVVEDGDEDVEEIEEDGDEHGQCEQVILQVDTNREEVEVENGDEDVEEVEEEQEEDGDEDCEEVEVKDELGTNRYQMSTIRSFIVEGLEAVEDGIENVEDVYVEEDVDNGSDGVLKSLLKILPMWLVFLVLFTILATMNAFFLQQYNNLHTNNDRAVLIYSSVQGLSSFAIDFLYHRISFLPKNEAVQIGVGMFSGILSCIFARELEVYRLADPGNEDNTYISISFLWLVPQFCMLGCMEGLTDEGLLKFYKSKVKERQFQGGLGEHVEVMMGLGKLLSVYLIFVRKSWLGDIINDNRLDKYYLVLIYVGLAKCIAYCCIARYCYKVQESTSVEIGFREGTILRRTKIEVHQQISPSKIVKHRGRCHLTIVFSTARVFDSYEDMMEWVQKIADFVGYDTKRSKTKPSGNISKIILTCGPSDGNIERLIWEKVGNDGVPEYFSWREVNGEKNKIMLQRIEIEEGSKIKYLYPNRKEMERKEENISEEKEEQRKEKEIESFPSPLSLNETRENNVKGTNKGTITKKTDGSVGLVVKCRKEKDSDTLMKEIPNIFHPYITSIQDVISDGHCGFRAIALCRGLHENRWPKIRGELLDELIHNQDRYKYVFGKDFDEMQQSLHFEGTGSASQENWMIMPDTAVLIANRFGVPVHFLSKKGSSTCFPLWKGPEDFQVPRALTVAHVGGDHYIMVQLERGYPMPTTMALWNRHKNLAANAWESLYEGRLGTTHSYEEGLWFGSKKRNIIKWGSA